MQPPPTISSSLALAKDFSFTYYLFRIAAYEMALKVK
jgi:hypothetical protein